MVWYAVLQKSSRIIYTALVTFRGTGLANFIRLFTTMLPFLKFRISRFWKPVRFDWRYGTSCNIRDSDRKAESLNLYSSQLVSHQAVGVWISLSKSHGKGIKTLPDWGPYWDLARVLSSSHQISICRQLLIYSLDTHLYGCTWSSLLPNTYTCHFKGYFPQACYPFLSLSFTPSISHRKIFIILRRREFPG